MSSEKFWETDKPRTLEEALRMMRFGCPLEKPLGDFDVNRYERRMVACADLIEKLVRTVQP